MKVETIDIEIYDWTVHVVERENEEDRDICRKKLVELGLKEDYVNESIPEDHKGGITFMSKDNRTNWIYLDIDEKPKMYMGIIIHEMQHVVDDLCNSIGLNCYEAKAYLAEFIGKRIINKERCKTYLQSQEEVEQEKQHSQEK